MTRIRSEVRFSQGNPSAPLKKASKTEIAFLKASSGASGRKSRVHLDQNTADAVNTFIERRFLSKEMSAPDGQCREMVVGQWFRVRTLSELEKGTADVNRKSRWETGDTSQGKIVQEKFVYT